MENILNNVTQNPLVTKSLIVVLGIILINIIVNFLKRVLSSHSASKEFRYGIRKGITFIGYFAIILLLIGTFSSQLDNITFAIGIAGAGIAFALQEVIVSLAGWLAISFGQFYRIGDRIELGGIKGDVIEIGVLRTVIMEIGEWVNADQYNGRIVRIANSFVFKAAVYNYSSDFPFVWDEISIPIKYGSDPHLARKILLSASNQILGDYSEFAKKDWALMTQKYAIEDAVIDPMIFMELNDNWIEFTLRYVVKFDKRRTTKDLLFSKVLDLISDCNGKVSIASTTFQLVEAPTLNVRVHS